MEKNKVEENTDFYSKSIRKDAFSFIEFMINML